MKLSKTKSEAESCGFPVTTRTEQRGWLNCRDIRSLSLLYSCLRLSHEAENHIHSSWRTSKLLPASRVTTDRSAGSTQTTTTHRSHSEMDCMYCSLNEF